MSTTDEQLIGKLDTLLNTHAYPAPPAWIPGPADVARQTELTLFDAEEGRPEQPIAAVPASALTVVVYGVPGPQGSKRHVGNGVMIESSKKVKPWRQDVKAAALEVMQCADIGAAAVHRPPLDGPLMASIVFTVRDQPASKPAWWPAGVRWSKSMRWRPASTPDLSKLLRATEDALTGVLWRDDARVVGYSRLEKYYCGYPATDVLDRPGAVIRVWSIGGPS